MNILLTNDDGIEARTLWAMHDVLKELGHVTVVAPREERSGVGHAITYREPVRVEQCDRENTYSLSGMPADCVKFGLLEVLDQNPDLVVSGINPGLNLGCNVFYSGTVAAAIEGVMNGIPSLAISCDPDGLDLLNALAEQARKTIEFLLNQTDNPGLGYNVNLPDPNISNPPIVYTHHHAKAFSERYVRADEPDSFKLDLPYGQMSSIEHPCDVTAIQNGKISVTPLRASLTDHKLLNTLNS